MGHLIQRFCCKNKPFAAPFAPEYVPPDTELSIALIVTGQFNKVRIINEMAELSKTVFCPLKSHLSAPASPHGSARWPGRFYMV